MSRTVRAIGINKVPLPTLEQAVYEGATWSDIATLLGISKAALLKERDRYESEAKQTQHARWTFTSIYKGIARGRKAIREQIQELTQVDVKGGKTQLTAQLQSLRTLLQHFALMSRDDAEHMAARYARETAHAAREHQAKLARQSAAPEPKPIEVNVNVVNTGALRQLDADAETSSVAALAKLDPEFTTNAIAGPRPEHGWMGGPDGNPVPRPGPDPLAQTLRQKPGEENTIAALAKKQQQEPKRRRHPAHRRGLLGTAGDNT